MERFRKSIGYKQSSFNLFECNTRVKDFACVFVAILFMGFAASYLPASAYGFKLPDSGQTQSYTGTLGEDADYSTNRLSYTDHGNGTITDNNTGIMWQQQSDGTGRLWTQAADYCDNLTLGGFSDWHLPSKKELVTVADYGKYGDYSPSLGGAYPLCSATCTSTIDAGNADYVWSVYNDGQVASLDKPYTWCSTVCCARGGQTWVSGNFTDNNNGTVTDSVTGLMWQQGEGGSKDWEAALNYCEDLSLGGYTDWRLPNIKELESITDDSRTNPAINKTYFPGVHSARYWSSTTYTFNQGLGWYGDFSNNSAGGDVTYSANYHSKSYSSYVRCVRGGQFDDPIELTASRAGTGDGKVTADGIDCGSDCTETFVLGTTVTFTATPSPGSAFTGWSGACTGTGETCKVIVGAAKKNVTAIFTAEHKGVVKLPRTGQTKCYDVAGTEIPCAGTGQDGEKQSGEAWPNPRFTVNGDCVTDNLTGLMWAKNGNLIIGGATSDNQTSWQGALDFVNTLNSTSGLCGHTDWRLPNVNELESLLNLQETDTAAWLNTQGFANAWPDYWSSTSVTADYAVYVNLTSAKITSDYIYTSFHRVWPVRTASSGVAEVWKTGQKKCYRGKYDSVQQEVPCGNTGQDGEEQAGAAWPNPRFTDNGDGTVNDNLTGLMWLKELNCMKTKYPAFDVDGLDKGDGQVFWWNALNFVSGINNGPYKNCGAGYSDWRLPNRKEVSSLGYASEDPFYVNVDNVMWTRYYTLPKGHPFTNAGILITNERPLVWTSTTDARYVDYAWHYYLGSTGSSSKEKEAPFEQVWPVRTGKSSASGNPVILNILKAGTGVGTVAVDMGTLTWINKIATGTYMSGSSVTLTATADASSNFTGWSGSCTGTSPTCILPMDASKNVTATFTRQAITSYTATFSAGWNFISLPMQVAEASISAVLKDVSPDVRVVWGYDNQNKEWLRYRPSITGNRLSTIDSDKGYWIYMNNPATLNLTGQLVDPSAIQLFEGWNLIAYNGTEGDNVSVALNALTGKWLIIWGWENGQWYAKHATVSDLPVRLLNGLSLGKAYWLKVNAATTWQQ